MVVLDVSIVTVALPSIGRDLHYTASGLQWVVNAYVLTFAGFLLLGGRAADLFGRRRVYLFGMALFTLASLAGGLATDAAWLTAARAVQGVAGACLSPDADDHRHDILGDHRPGPWASGAPSPGPAEQRARFSAASSPRPCRGAGCCS
jgi:MFS family permease